MSQEFDDELERLIALANQGDEKARECLLEHTSNRLLKLTRKMLSQYPAVRRWEETDDVLTAAMMRLHEALKAVKPESARHYFNLAAKHIRWRLLELKKHYYGPQGIGANHHTDHQPPDESGGVLATQADRTDDLGRWEQLHEQIEKLPKDLRDVTELIYYHELTLKQVAQVLEIGVSTVKRRWQEARLQLNDQLGGSF